MKTKVLFVGDRKFMERYTDASVYERYEIADVPFGTDDDTALAVGGDAEIIVCDAMSRISAKLINGMPDLKLIHSAGVGYQDIDVNAATGKGVTVCNCRGINSKAVAEHAVLLMLRLLKDVCRNDEEVRNGNQMPVKQGYMARGDLKELGECSVGIIGLGDIGKILASYLNVMGCRVVYYDAFRQTAEKESELNVEYKSLDELLRISDIVSIHVPVFDSTRNMCNAEFFSKMKQGAYFVNTARGELCVSRDLLAAIESGHIAGAGLDCVPGEPVGKDNDIFKADEKTLRKIIFSPHTAGITGKTFVRGFDMIWKNCDALTDGGTLINIVNRK